MITAPQTTTAYFSNLLPKRCPTLYQSLDTILRERQVEYHLLPNTRDIWCRDYMPIQTDEKRFVFYKYNPNYLQKPHLKRMITDVTQIGEVECLQQVEAVTLDLVVDGGNVVKCGNKIVMTEKVFFENRDKSRDEVRRLLEEAFLCEIVFLPWDKVETYGHSDGIIHYAGGNRVLMTNYADSDADMARKFTRLLDKHFEVIRLEYNVKRKHRRSWAYINFLQIGNLVLVPQLGYPQALPQCEVIGIEALEAVRKGGALNCISWNVRE